MLPCWGAHPEKLPQANSCLNSAWIFDYAGERTILKSSPAVVISDVLIAHGSSRTCKSSFSFCLFFCLKGAVGGKYDQTVQFTFLHSV